MLLTSTHSRPNTPLAPPTLTTSVVDRPDTDLVRQGRTSHEAFTELSRRHYSFCLRLASRVLGNTADAEDAVQDAFLSAYMNLHGFESRSNFRSWLTRIVVNQCRMNFRKQRRAQIVSIDKSDSGGPEVEFRSSDQTPEEIHTTRELQRVLHLHIQRLPCSWRTPISLQTNEDLGIDAVAQRLALSPEAVKSRLRRARLQLKSQLEPYFCDYRRPASLRRSHKAAL